MLNRIKSEIEINIYTGKRPPLRVPKHYKQISRAVASSASSIPSELMKAEIERIFFSAFDLMPLSNFLVKLMYIIP